MYSRPISGLLGSIIAIIITSCNFRPLDHDLSEEQYAFAAECLDAFFIFRERMPSDLYSFSTPEALYKSVNEQYTEFLNRSKALERNARFTTSQGGIGISMDTVTNGIVIKEVFNNSPGEKAGLQPRDIITRVDNVPVSGMEWDTLLALLQGEIGSPVNLRIERAGDLKNIIVIRGLFRAPTVYVDSIDISTALITMKSFLRETNLPGGTSEEFDAAMQKTGWATNTILDLRKNGGGYISECFAVTSLLVSENTPIISTHERSFDVNTGFSDDIDTTYYSKGAGIFSQRQLFILVDEKTASASEILVSCLMEREKVTVIGDTTFGKGRGQGMWWGPDSVLAYITTMTLRPAGNNVAAYDLIGIAPDICSDTIDAFDVALDIIEETFPAKRRAERHDVCRPGRSDVSLPLIGPCAIVTGRMNDND